MMNDEGEKKEFASLAVALPCRFADPRLGVCLWRLYGRNYSNMGRPGNNPMKCDSAVSRADAAGYFNILVVYIYECY
jgi:hypothetical protein